MRVVAFSCAHLAQPETQQELYGHYLDYAPIQSLVETLHQNDGWPMDAGSITHSRTYGEIVDGVPELKVVPSG